MTGPKATHQSSSTPTLASRPLPPRVRSLLSGLLDLVGGRLQRRITTAFNDAEGLLFTLGGGDDIQGIDRISAITRFQRAKTYVFPRFMVALEAALAVVRDPAKPSRSAGGDVPMSDWLTLVDHDVQAEDAVITEISSRANLRHSLALSLLGQRYGVIAAKAPYEPDRLPVGPRQLCRLLSDAMNGLEMLPPHRQMVLRQFDRAAIQEYGELIDAINEFLVREDVLPTLHFVPLRKRPQSQRGEEHAARPPSGEPSRAQTAWPGEMPGGDAADDAAPGPDLLAVLQQLIATRAVEDEAVAPAAGTHLLASDELDAILAKLQRQAATAAATTSVRDYAQLRAAIRSELPAFLANGDTVPLRREDAELLELMCLLFTQVMAHVRASSPSAALLSLIQIPLTRHVLLDRDVLARRHHAARRMLNTIAEAGAVWRAEQDSDPALLSRLQNIAERIAREYDGDGELFERLNEEANDLIRAQIERAKLSERRHIEAARGREKLALARLRAVEAIEASIEGRRIPEYVHTLLAQTWSDVLALTLLRHGPDAPAFKRQSDIARRLAAAACADSGQQEPLSGNEASELLEEIRQALSQVGYHEEEARMIASALTELRSESDADTRRRIEDIQARLAARARLGEQLHAVEDAREQPLDSDIEAWRQRLLDLPFGTWMEFGAVGPDAHPVRSRLAWFSAVTGLGLFVNTRGQRVGEHALTWLAHEMAAGRLRVVEIGHDTLVDRAWDELVESLRQLAAGEVAENGAAA